MRILKHGLLLLAWLFGLLIGSKASAETIKIASFNIQTFGVTKASKPEVMAILADIISRFDIVAIQEIRDATGTAIQELEKDVDALGNDYAYILGPRLGRTSSKEQYAFMYRTETIEAGNAYTYDDTAEDLFHREPLIARFKGKNGNFDFVLITIHTDPDEATEEINSLTNAVRDAKKHFPNESDFIVLGDLNADCSYYDEDDMADPLRGPRYVWLITNDMDTNLSASDCTYDRIIVTKACLEDYDGNRGVFLFDQEFGLSNEKAKEVSDHYPVWSEYYTDRDKDRTQALPCALLLLDKSREDKKP